MRGRGRVEPERTRIYSTQRSQHIDQRRDCSNQPGPSLPSPQSEPAVEASGASGCSASIRRLDSIARSLASSCLCCGQWSCSRRRRTRPTKLLLLLLAGVDGQERGTATGMKGVEGRWLSGRVLIATAAPSAVLFTPQLVLRSTAARADEAGEGREQQGRAGEAAGEEGVRRNSRSTTSAREKAL